MVLCYMSILHYQSPAHMKGGMNPTDGCWVQLMSGANLSETQMIVYMSKKNTKQWKTLSVSIYNLSLLRAFST